MKAYNMEWKLKAIVQEVIDLLRREIKEIFSSENKLKVLAAKIGLDKPVKFTYLNTILALLQGPVTIYFIVLCLTPKQQGVWFTFYNLAALTIFAELGFANLISQRVSYIFSKLELKDGYIAGSHSYTDQLFSLIRFSIRFYSVIISLSIALLGAVGYFYFHTEPTIFIAFFVFSVFGGGKLLVSLLQSIYQGFNKVAEVQKSILISSIISQLLIWLLLLSGFNVWALAIGAGVSVALLLFLLYRAAAAFWWQALRYRTVNKYSWLSKILPLQGKYAISAISSYLIFYLHVPAVYKFENGVTAGKFGMTLSVVGSIFSIAAGWNQSRVPTFNLLAAKRQKRELLKLLRKSVIFSCTLYILGSISLLILVYIINVYHFYNDRILDLPFVALILSYQFATLIITPIGGAYLRAHGDDPWYIVAIVCAILTTISIFTILPRYGLWGLLISTNVINWFVLLPLGAKVYFDSKKKYDLTWYITDIKDDLGKAEL